MWTKYLHRPDELTSLFEVGPLLSGFRLSEINWEFDDGDCLLRGTLAQFADFPQPNWEDDANRVAIRLRLVQVEEFAFSGTRFDLPVDMQVETNRRSALVISGQGNQGDDEEEVSFRFVCADLEVDDIFAYHSVEAAPVRE